MKGSLISVIKIHLFGENTIYHCNLDARTTLIHCFYK